MGFKFAGTSPGNSAENHSTTVTNEHMRRTVVSCTTVLVVRDPIPKGLSRFLSVLQRTSTTDRHTLGGPSYITDMTVKDPSLKGLHFLSVPRRTVIITTVRADCRRFAPQVCFTYHSCISIFLCIGDNFMSFCWGLGKWKVSARVKSK